MNEESNPAYDRVMKLIYESDMTPKTQLAALGLLGAAISGALVCTRERAGQLCGTKSWGATRRMLGKIQATGIIHYRTNEMVYVAFGEYYYEEGDQPRAKSDLLRAKSDQPRALFDQDDADEVVEDDPVITFRSTTREKRADEAGGKGLGWVGNDLISDQEGDTQPNPRNAHRAPPETSPALEPEQEWAYQLLTDSEIGVMPDRAYACVKWHTAAYVVRVVAAWWAERSRTGVGALVWRLMNPERSRPGPAFGEFLGSDLYWRHYPLSETETRKRAYITGDMGDWMGALPRPEERL